MEAQELIQNLKSRYKTFSYFKLALQRCYNKTEFESICEHLFDEIFANEKMYDDFRREKEGVVPIPVQKEYSDLCNYSTNVLNFFNLFKQLKGF